MAKVTAYPSFGLNESNIFLKKYRSVELKPCAPQRRPWLLWPVCGLQTDHSAAEVPKKVAKTSSDIAVIFFLLWKCRAEETFADQRIFLISAHLCICCENVYQKKLFFFTKKYHFSKTFIISIFAVKTYIRRNFFIFTQNFHFSKTYWKLSWLLLGAS